MTIFYLAYLLICTPLKALALETDNYLAWRVELKDSSKKINHFLKNQINQSLIRINNKSHPQRCLDVTREIASNFRALLVHDNPVEKWLLRNLNKEEFYPHHLFFVEESIFRNPYRIYIPEFGLAPNVQINGINLGMDKLTHWSSTGRRYFNIYIAAKNAGKTELEATVMAIDYGIMDELSLHGYWASGVFSFADLEANYQGLLFYKKFCFDRKNTYLKLTPEKKWILVDSPKIEEYVNPYWDETFNTSHFISENWKKVAPVLKENYCNLIRSDEVLSLRLRYLQSDKSFSTKYLNELSQQNQKEVPSRFNQSLEKLCQNLI
jgi:hypothetical protein